jgi:subtilase family serine protease
VPKYRLATNLIFVIVILLCLSVSVLAFAADKNGPGLASTSQTAKTFKHACGKAKKGYASCLALISTSSVSAPHGKHTLIRNVASPDAASPGQGAPYRPSDLATAYHLPTNALVSQTVALVNAYDDPNAESDLNTYRSTFGLPSCTSSSGCFTKVDEHGGTNYPSADSGWAGEISLDLDMVSAICNHCKILLIEANSSSFSDLGTAVNTAVRMGANEISNSYGGTESSGDSSSCSSYYNHPGVAITASSGDQGLGVELPADCPHVVAVGGTTLTSNGSETAWNTSSSDGAGGGCSSYIAGPPWESSAVTGCSRRAVADVSAVADPNTGLYVYDTYQAAGWRQGGGTSASSPIIAAVYALAGGVSGEAASLPWNNYSKGCLFTVGGEAYSYQAGLGSPNGIGCF